MPRGAEEESTGPSNFEPLEWGGDHVGLHQARRAHCSTCLGLSFLSCEMGTLPASSSESRTEDPVRTPSTKLRVSPQESVIACPTTGPSPPGVLTAPAGGPSPRRLPPGTPPPPPTGCSCSSPLTTLILYAHLPSLYSRRFASILP